MDIELLNEERLIEWCRRLDLPEEAQIALSELAGEVRGDEALLNRFRAEHDKTVARGEWYSDGDQPPGDPAVEARLGGRTSLFYLLVYLAALPYAEETYRQRGIDPAIFDATMADFRIWLVDAYDTHGDWRFEQFHWLWHHLSGQLFRLGRLQFMLGAFEGGVTALAARYNAGGGNPAVRKPAGGSQPAAGGNSRVRQIVLLADPDVPLREDGYAYEAGDRPPTGQPWKPVLEIRPDGWEGNAITPKGCARRLRTFYSAANWEIALQRGDTILDIHIPRGERMTVADCQDSLRQAFDFFAQQAPERPFKAGYCHTWFFSPQLQRLLPLESNIVRFQREFYLYPFAGKLSFLWMYVFGQKYPDPAGAPRDTALRRSVLDWLEAGKEIFDLPGLMFHGPEDWGTQPYMLRWGSS